MTLSLSRRAATVYSLGQFRPQVSSEKNKQKAPSGMLFSSRIKL